MTQPVRFPTEGPKKQMVMMKPRNMGYYPSKSPRTEEPAQERPYALQATDI